MIDVGFIIILIAVLLIVSVFAFLCYLDGLCDTSLLFFTCIFFSIILGIWVFIAKHNVKWSFREEFQQVSIIHNVACIVDKTDNSVINLNKRLNQNFTGNEIISIKKYNPSCSYGLIFYDFNIECSISGGE